MADNEVGGQVEQEMGLFKDVDEMISAFEEDFDIKLTDYRSAIDDDQKWAEFKKTMMKQIMGFKTSHKDAFEQMTNPKNERCEKCGRIG
jgi:hypothetical protein